MKKHTPGPWKVDIHKDGKTPLRVYAPSTALVCDANGGMSRAGNLANAQLIAAAPDLLEALQLLLNAFIHKDGNAKGNKAKTDIITLNLDVRDALNVAQATINKVTS